MRILYCNIYYPKSHRHMEETTFCNLSKLCELTVLSPREWYENKQNNVEYLEFNNHQFNMKNNRIGRLNCSLLNLLEIVKTARRTHPDIIIIGEFENTLLPIMLLWNPKRNRTILMHHNNIDQFRNHPLFERFFDLIKNKYYQLVLEEFIGAELVNKYGVNKDRVIFWPHPIYEKKEVCLDDLVYDCVGISQSNDENIISKIITKEMETNFIKKAGLHIILRSKKHVFDNSFLKVINGWLEESEYNDLIRRSRCIYLPFSPSFQYRPSGTVIDAFSSRKFVIGSDIALIRELSMVYPHICKIFSAESFLADIVSFKHTEESNYEFDQFSFCHNDSVILQKMNDSFIRITKGACK